jgi:hypothetical protein
MKPREPETVDPDLCAEIALEQARKLPRGFERSEALKRASALRVAADQKGVLFAKRGRPFKN